MLSDEGARSRLSGNVDGGIVAIEERSRGDDAIVGVDDVPTAGGVGVNLGGGDDVVDVVAIDGGGGCGGVMACVRFVIDVVANLFRFVIDDDAAS